MASREEINEFLVENAPDDQFILFEGLDDAVVGIVHGDDFVHKIVYDVPKIIELLKKNDGMSEEDAWEWFEFNIMGTKITNCEVMYLHPLPGSGTPPE